MTDPQAGWLTFIIFFKWDVMETYFTRILKNKKGIAFKFFPHI